MADGPSAAFNCGEQASDSWWVRARVAADLLSTLPSLRLTGASLADVGCGDGKLRALLNERKFSVDYRGFDLLPQGADVVAFDVCSQILSTHTVAVLLGVTEYLPDLTGALRRLAGAVEHVLWSHVVRDEARYSHERLQERGWVNHLTVPQCEAVATAAGLLLRRHALTPDGRTVLLLCDTGLARR